MYICFAISHPIYLSNPAFSVFVLQEGAMCCASHAACDQKVDQLAISVLSALAAAIEAGKDMQSVRRVYFGISRHTCNVKIGSVLVFIV